MADPVEPLDSTRSPDTKKRKNRKRFFFSLFQGMLLFVIILGGTYGYFRLNQKVLETVEIWRSEVLDDLEETLGLRIEYARISPSFFNRLSISDFAVYSRYNDHRLIYLEDLKITYRMRSLLADPLAINDYIELFQAEGGEVFLDYEEDWPLILEIVDSLKGDSTSNGSLGLTFDIRLKNIFARFESDAVSITGTHTDAYLQHNGEEYLFTAGTDYYMHLNRPDLTFYQLGARVDFSGSLGSSFTQVNTMARIRNFTSNLFDLSEQNFQVTIDHYDLKAVKTEDRIPLDASYTFNMKSLEMEVEGSFEDFVPETVFFPKARIMPIMPWLNSRLSGSGTIDMPYPGSFFYTFHGDVRLENALMPLPVYARLGMQGDLKNVRLDYLYADSSIGSLAFFGFFDYTRLYPQGSFRVEDFNITAEQTLSAEGAVTKKEGGLLWDFTRISTGELLVEETRIFIDPEPGFSAIDYQIETALGKNYINTRIDGRIELGQPRLQADLSLFEFSPDWLVSVLPASFAGGFQLPDILSGGEVFTSLQLDTNLNNNFSAIIESFEMVQGTSGDRYLSLDGKVSPRSLRIDHFTLQYGVYESQGRIFVGFREDGTIETDMGISLDRYYYQLVGNLDFEEGLLLYGNYGIEAWLRFNRTLDFFASAEDLPVPVLISPDKEYFFQTDFKLSGSLADGLYVDADQLSVSMEEWGMLKKPMVQLSGIYEGKSLVLHRLGYKDSVSSVEGVGWADFGRTESGEAEVDLQIDMNNPETGEGYRFGGSLSGTAIDGEVSVTSTPLRRFLSEALTGYLDADLYFGGSPVAPRIQGNLATVQGALSGNPLELEASIVLDEQRFWIPVLKSVLSNQIYDGELELDFESDRFYAEVDMNADLVDPAIQTGMSVNGIIAEDIELFTVGRLANALMEGELFIKNTYFLNSYIRSKSLNFTRLSDRILFDDPVTDSISGYLGNEGDIEVNIREPLPLSARISGKLGSELDLFCSGIDLNLEQINAFLTPVDLWNDIPVRFDGGRLTGELELSGVPSDPDFGGILRIENAELDFPFIEDRFRPFTAQIEVSEKNFDLPNMVLMTENGNGYIKADGILTLDHWKAGGYSFGVEIGGDSGIHGEMAISWFPMDGWLSGVADCTGNADGMQIEGDMRIDYFTASVDLGGRESSGEVRYQNAVRDFEIEVDMALTTGRQVRVYLPNPTIPIIIASAERGNTLNLAYNNRTEQFSLDGVIDLTGEMNYFTRKFYLKEGSITFDENQDKFDPSMYVLAEIRQRQVVDGENEEIKIYLEDNFRLSESLSPSLYSEPSLPEDTLRGMIGDSVFAIDTLEDGNFLNNVLYTSGSLVNSFWVMQPLEEAIQDLLQVDFVSLSSNLLPTLLSNVLSSGSGSTLGLVDYLDNTQLMLGKYLGEDVYLEMMFSLNETSERSGLLGNLGIGSNFGLEFQTPFFLIDWSFDMQYADNLFTTDNSLTLSFKQSF